MLIGFGSNFYVSFFFFFLTFFSFCCRDKKRDWPRFTTTLRPNNASWNTFQVQAVEVDPGLVKPRVRSLILTEFYRVFVSDFTGFPWLPSQHFRFYWVLPSFFSIGIGFYLVLPFLTGFLSSFTNLIKVLPSFT